MFDSMITNGTMIDGESQLPYKSNLGIKNNKIVYIGNEYFESQSIIDATDKIVTPGFIDIHTHCDLTFQKYFNIQNPYRIPYECKRNTNFLNQGVTTVVTGNCGLGYSDANFWMEFVSKVNMPTNVFHLIPYLY